MPEAADCTSSSGEATRALAWNLVLEAELLRVVAGLTAEGIEVIVLKGVPLARRLGTRLGLRAIGDNDLLVRPDAVERAVRVLIALGYQPPPPRFIDLDAMATSRPCPAGTLWVDLHWGAFLTPLYPVDVDLLWSRTEALALGTGDVRVFDPPLTLVHLAAHYAQHRFRQHRVLEDLAAAWNQWATDIDHDALRQLADATGQRHTLAYVFRVATEQGLLNHPAPILRSSRARAVHALSPIGRAGSQASQGDYLGHVLIAILARPLPAARWLWSLAFPPSDRVAGLQGSGGTLRRGLRYARRLLNPLRVRRRRRGR